MKRVIFYGILIFIFSILVGYYFSVLWKNGGSGIAYEEQKNETDVEETGWEEEKVSYNASFALKKYYNECGHFKFQYSELPIELVNLSREEVEEAYPDWDVEEFSSNNVVLSQKINNVCDEHYVLKLVDDSIDIYHVGASGELELYKSTDISGDYLTSTDVSNLESGIYVYGMGNLNSAIEDFE